ncbi:MAG: hypothetical protein ACRDP6_15240 [Actinoallomurus sp.]
MAPVEADVVRGRTVIVLAELADRHPLCRVGGDAQPCTAGPNQLVAGGRPDDLKAYRQEVIEVFAAG